MKPLTQTERELLQAVRSARRFPLVRFELRNSEEPGLRSIALNHVYITDPEDSMELVKERSAALESLRRRGLVRISYALPAYVQSDYQVYYRSSLYELLCHTVLEAQGKPGFLFNLPAMRFGQVFPL
ncbi:MAG TPA: hypothetical protein IAA80_10505 [Candidatus Gallacutalibacter pullistercoris]|nr:hypothetical protein [Candidatus Gallacutalibacter pullistercoris]